MMGGERFGKGSISRAARITSSSGFAAAKVKQLLQQLVYSRSDSARVSALLLLEAKAEELLLNTWLLYITLRMLDAVLCNDLKAVSTALVFARLSPSCFCNADNEQQTQEHQQLQQKQQKQWQQQQQHSLQQQRQQQHPHQQHRQQLLQQHQHQHPQNTATFLSSTLDERNLSWNHIFADGKEYFKQGSGLQVIPASGDRSPLTTNRQRPTHAARGVLRLCAAEARLPESDLMTVAAVSYNDTAAAAQNTFEATSRSSAAAPNSSKSEMAAYSSFGRVICSSSSTNRSFAAAANNNAATASQIDRPSGASPDGIWNSASGRRGNILNSSNASPASLSEVLLNGSWTPRQTATHMSIAEPCNFKSNKNILPSSRTAEAATAFVERNGLVAVDVQTATLAVQDFIPQNLSIHNALEKESSSNESENSTAIPVIENSAVCLPESDGWRPLGSARPEKFVQSSVLLKDCEELEGWLQQRQQNQQHQVLQSQQPLRQRQQEHAQQQLQQFQLHQYQQLQQQQQQQQQNEHYMHVRQHLQQPQRQDLVVFGGVSRDSVDAYNKNDAGKVIEDGSLFILSGISGNAAVAPRTTAITAGARETWLSSSGSSSPHGTIAVGDDLRQQSMNKRYVFQREHQHPSQIASSECSVADSAQPASSGQSWTSSPLIENSSSAAFRNDFSTEGHNQAAASKSTIGTTVNSDYDCTTSSPDKHNYTNIHCDKHKHKCNDLKNLASNRSDTFMSARRGGLPSETVHTFSDVVRLACMQVFTSICICLDVLFIDPQWIQRLVSILRAIVARKEDGRNAVFRSFSFHCLEEIECNYPGLLLHLLDEVSDEKAFHTPFGAAECSSNTQIDAETKRKLLPCHAGGAVTENALTCSCVHTQSDQPPIRPDSFIISLMRNEGPKDQTAEARGSLLLTVAKHIIELSAQSCCMVSMKDTDNFAEDLCGADKAAAQALAVNGKRPLRYDSVTSDASGVSKPSSLNKEAVTLTPTISSFLLHYYEKLFSFNFHLFWSFTEWGQTKFVLFLEAFHRLLGLSSAAATEHLLGLLFSNCAPLVHAFLRLLLSSPHMTNSRLTLLVKQKVETLIMNQSLPDYMRILGLRWLAVVLEHPVFAALFLRSTPLFFIQPALRGSCFVLKDQQLQLLLLFYRRKHSTSFLSRFPLEDHAFVASTKRTPASCAPGERSAIIAHRCSAAAVEEKIAATDATLKDVNSAAEKEEKPDFSDTLVVQGIPALAADRTGAAAAAVVVEGEQHKALSEIHGITCSDATALFSETATHTAKTAAALGKALAAGFSVATGELEGDAVAISSSENMPDSNVSADHAAVCFSGNVLDVFGLLRDVHYEAKPVGNSAIICRFLLRLLRAPCQCLREKVHSFICQSLRQNPTAMMNNTLVLLHHLSRSGSAALGTFLDLQQQPEEQKHKWQRQQSERLFAAASGSGAAAAVPAKYMLCRSLTPTLSRHTEEALIRKNDATLKDQFVAPYCLLLALGKFFQQLQPSSQLPKFLPLLLRLAAEPLLPPAIVLHSLRRLLAVALEKNPLFSSYEQWIIGTQVLDASKQLMMTSSQSVLYESMCELLLDLAEATTCIDIRANALFLLKLYTPVGIQPLKSFTDKADERMRNSLVQQHLCVVLPVVYQFVGRVSFLELRKSYRERYEVCGLLDRKAAFFLNRCCRCCCQQLVPPLAQHAVSRNGELVDADDFYQGATDAKSAADFDYLTADVKDQICGGELCCNGRNLFFQFHLLHCESDKETVAVLSNSVATNQIGVHSQMQDCEKYSVACPSNLPQKRLSRNPESKYSCCCTCWKWLPLRSIFEDYFEFIASTPFFIRMPFCLQFTPNFRWAVKRLPAISSSSQKCYSTSTQSGCCYQGEPQVSQALQNQQPSQPLLLGQPHQQQSLQVYQQQQQHRVFLCSEQFQKEQQQSGLEVQHYEQQKLRHQRQKLEQVTVSTDSCGREKISAEKLEIVPNCCGADAFSLGELFGIELSFRQGADYAPLCKVRLPYLQNRSLLQNLVNFQLNEGNCCESALVEGKEPEFKDYADASSESFPFTYKIVLKLQPLAPVPAEVAVDVKFSDAKGAHYQGSLNNFCIFFQDLFLPVTGPPAFRPFIFQRLWADARMTRSVKILEFNRRIVHRMIEMTLKPFVLPCNLADESEDFDFEQDEDIYALPDEFFYSSVTAESLECNKWSVDGCRARQTQQSSSHRRRQSKQKGEQRGSVAPTHMQPWSSSSGRNESRAGSRFSYSYNSTHDDSLSNGCDEVCAIPHTTPLTSTLRIIKNIDNDATSLLREYFPSPLADGNRIERRSTRSKYQTYRPRTEIVRAVTFLPPRFHMLLKFSISSRTSVVRIVVDRYQILGYLDSFFATACRLAEVDAFPRRSQS